MARPCLARQASGAPSPERTCPSRRRPPVPWISSRRRLMPSPLPWIRNGHGTSRARSSSTPSAPPNLARAQLRRCSRPSDNVALYVAPAMLTKPAHTVSALQAIHMAASAGSFSNLIDVDHLLDRRVTGGLQLLALALASRLEEKVALGHDVTAVTWSENGAVVQANGERFEATGVTLAAAADSGGAHPLRPRTACRAPPGPPAPVIRPCDQDSSSLQPPVLARSRAYAAPDSSPTSSSTRSTTTPPKARPKAPSCRLHLRPAPGPDRPPSMLPSAAGRCLHPSPATSATGR